MSEGHAFDIRDPLPSGVTVLEASAGTGKTYTIAALAARYVAEGTPLERLLLVTFTRMATGELRERVRERLVSVERGLARGVAAGDPVVSLLLAGSPEEVGARRARLARAVASFDAATIATTHGFCQEVLGGLGIGGDLEPDVTFVEDLGELVDDVVDDLYVRRFYRGGSPEFDRAEAGEIAYAVTANPNVPIAEAAGEVPSMRRRLALAIRGELERRKRRLSVMGYDDLLTRLDASLSGEGGPATAARLRARYDVVLVDEFQDTDPVQWDIMRRAFGDGTLVLIGDPKQAIYAFRGADVYAYLDAAAAAETRATLGVNWRSDQGLIDAFDALLTGVKLGHEGIVYRQVRAAEANQEPRLIGAPRSAPLRIRVVPRAAVDRTPKGFARKASAREHIACDVAAEVVALLASDAEIETRSEDGAVVGRERVRPGHVAMLVPWNRTAALVRQALADAGVPAVINGAGSVFTTEPAREWLQLLEAIERPASPTRAHSAALTCFLGWSAEEVAAADDDAWEVVHTKLHDWARVLRERGVATLTERISLAEGLPRRVLAVVDGERRLTDLRHVAQLLHTAASTEQLGTTAMAAWLRRRIAEAADDTGDEERSRRLESDAEAVQVLTIHRSKGLEFPIVFLPFLWEPGFIPEDPGPVFFHDPDAGDARTIDVALQGADYQVHEQQYVREQRGEDLRLAYVALTRARHQAVVWWAGSMDSRNSPLGRLLFSRDDAGNVAPLASSTPSDEKVIERLGALAAVADGAIGVEVSELVSGARWDEPRAAVGELATAAFERSLDPSWRRTSYTDMASGAYESKIGSEPEEGGIDDEPGADAVVHPDPVDAAPPPGSLPSLLSDTPVGASFGTLVHDVLEAADFAPSDLLGEVSDCVAAALARRPVELEDPSAVTSGLAAAIETPLGPVVDGLRLRDLPRGDRLDELRFELPLAGGDAPAAAVTMEAIAAVLRQHLPANDPLAAYADRLGDPALRPVVRGYLTGSLDLVLRAGGRFAVVDYKTNWLGGPDEPLTTWHHRPEALAAEMRRRHYGLQALLYTVALHRYLRWRLEGYDADQHLAGVLYLFLRGMVGPDTPVVDGTPCGVFAWRPPGALVEALSDALDGGRSA